MGAIYTAEQKIQNINICISRIIQRNVLSKKQQFQIFHRLNKARNIIKAQQSHKQNVDNLISIKRK